MNEAFDGNSMNFRQYQQQARLTAIYPRSHMIIYPALGLAGEAGETCEKVKKWIRDDNGVMTEERKQMISKEIGDTIWYCSNLATDCGLDLQRIANDNLAKLASRQERGKLQGSGDDR